MLFSMRLILLWPVYAGPTTSSHRPRASQEVSDTALFGASSLRGRCTVLIGESFLVTHLFCVPLLVVIRRGVVHYGHYNPEAKSATGATFNLSEFGFSNLRNNPSDVLM